MGVESELISFNNADDNIIRCSIFCFLDEYTRILHLDILSYLSQKKKIIEIKVCTFGFVQK